MELSGWRPEPVTVAGRIDPWPAGAFAALLDEPAPADRSDELPPLWHWFHLLDHPAQAELGDDGHPTAGPFQPPMPDRRRMFAGGRVRFAEPLRFDDQVTRRSTLVAATPKTGRSGEMVFVTVRHEYLRDGAVAIVEEQDFAYRSQPAGERRALALAGPAEDGEQVAEPAWRVRVEPDAAMLFRFSALTYNTHRIHYDHPYVTAVEGYPGLVVHGPLLALLLLELPRRFAPDRAVRSFAYRLRSPVFAGAAVEAVGTAGNGEVGQEWRAGRLPSRERSRTRECVLRGRAGERDDERVRARPVAGQLGLEQGGQEERVLGQLEHAHLAFVVVAGEHHAVPAQGVQVGGVRPVGADVALHGPVRADHLRDAAAGGEPHRPLVPGQRARQWDDHRAGGAGGVLGVVDVEPADRARELQHGVLEAPARAQERDVPLARGPDGGERAGLVAVRAAGNGPHGVEAVDGTGLRRVVRRDPVGVEHQLVALGERVQERRDADV